MYKRDIQITLRPPCNALRGSTQYIYYKPFLQVTATSPCFISLNHLSLTLTFSFRLNQISYRPGTFLDKYRVNRVNWDVSKKVPGEQGRLQKSIQGEQGLFQKSIQGEQGRFQKRTGTFLEKYRLNRGTFLEKYRVNRDVSKKVQGEQRHLLNSIQGEQERFQKITW